MNEANWYNSLQKPFFAPPSWVFGPVWSVLYIMIIIAIYISIQGVSTGAFSKKLLGIIVVNIVSNIAFSPIQFTLQNNVLALLDIVIVLLSLYMWIYEVRSQQVLLWLLVPYALWVSFATILQVSITFLNL